MARLARIGELQRQLDAAAADAAAAAIAANHAAAVAAQAEEALEPAAEAPLNLDIGMLFNQFPHETAIIMVRNLAIGGFVSSLFVARNAYLAYDRVYNSRTHAPYTWQATTLVAMTVLRVAAFTCRIPVWWVMAQRYNAAREAGTARRVTRALRAAETTCEFQFNKRASMLFNAWLGVALLITYVAPATCTLSVQLSTLCWAHVAFMLISRLVMVAMFFRLRDLDLNRGINIARCVTQTFVYRCMTTELCTYFWFMFYYVYMLGTIKISLDSATTKTTYGEVLSAHVLAEVATRAADSEGTAGEGAAAATAQPAAAAAPTAKAKKRNPPSEDCPICLATFLHVDEVRCLNCPSMHLFHRECIDPWLLQQKNECPLCLFPIDIHGDGNSSDSTSEEEGEEEAAARVAGEAAANAEDARQKAEDELAGAVAEGAAIDAERERAAAVNPGFYNHLHNEERAAARPPSRAARRRARRAAAEEERRAAIEANLIALRAQRIGWRHGPLPNESVAAAEKRRNDAQLARTVQMRLRMSDEEHDAIQQEAQTALLESQTQRKLLPGRFPVHVEKRKK